MVGRSNGKRTGPSPPAAAPVSDLPLSRAQLLLECTRAVLRAKEEPELGGTLCRRLVHPGVYSEAAMILVDSAEPASPRRAYYAGADKGCLEDAGRFWAGPEREAALQSLLASPGARTAQAASGCVTLALTLNGRAAGALALSISAGRSADAAEIQQLKALADDVSCAVAKLRDSTGIIEDITERKFAEEALLREERCCAPSSMPCPITFT